MENSGDSASGGIQSGSKQANLHHHHHPAASITGHEPEDTGVMSESFYFGKVDAIVRTHYDYHLHHRHECRTRVRRGAPDILGCVIIRAVYGGGPK